MVTFRAVTDENIRTCLALNAGEGKENFVANSFAIAWLHRNCAEPLVVYSGDVAVGFLLLTWDGESESPPKCCVSRIMTDKNHQRKGYAAAAIHAAIAHIKQKMPDVGIITLSVSPKNTAAIRLYEKLGFTTDGALSFGEIVMKFHV